MCSFVQMCLFKQKTLSRPQVGWFYWRHFVSMFFPPNVEVQWEWCYQLISIIRIRLWLCVFSPFFWLHHLLVCTCVVWLNLLIVGYIYRCDYVCIDIPMVYWWNPRISWLKSPFHAFKLREKHWSFAARGFAAPVWRMQPTPTPAPSLGSRQMGWSRSVEKDAAKGGV